MESAEAKKGLKKASIKERLSLYLCPAALGAAICYSVIYALYNAMAIPYTVMFAVCEVLLFSLFDILKKRKYLGGLIYTVMLILMTFISIRLMIVGTRLNGNWMAPLEWFYGAEGADEKQPLFLNSVFIGGGFFIISVMYYFTQIRYRTLGIMLCILFPFIIYARRSNVMPEIMVTVIVSLYLAVIIHNRHTDPSLPQKDRILLRVDRSYIISIAVFVAVTGTVTMMVEKPVYLSKLERDSNYFDYDQSETAGSGTSLDNISQTSSKRYGDRNYSGDILFYFETDGEKPVYYLCRQPYAVWNGSVWETNGQVQSSSYFYTKEYPEYANDDIINDMKVLLERNAASDIPDTESVVPLHYGHAYSESFAPMYLPAPYGTIAEDAGSNGVKYRKFPNGSIIRTGRSASTVNVLDDEFYFYDQGIDLYRYAAGLGFSSEDYIDFLLQNDSDEAFRLLTDYITAREGFTDNQNISQNVAELARQITDGCYSDIEKAAALEAYFEENGYVYDEEYDPEDKSIDYFIFEGKTGVCSSYATAMTIMARSVGLPARYVEGFAAFEQNDEGIFQVRDNHAHAFVEVYISGAGWITFDPTVSGYRNLTANDDGQFAAVLIRILSRSIAAIVVAVFIIFVLLKDRLIEFFFRFSQLFRKPKEKTLKLYANLIRVINTSTNEDYSSYTVKMITEYLTSTRGEAPDKLIMLFEKTAFGGYEPTDDEYREAYAEYKRQYKYLRKKQ